MKRIVCRLYGFSSTELTKVECSLVHAQNALLVQSRRDQAGLSHADGWGVATYENTYPHVERQAWAAYHGERFREVAARVYSRTVIAHVRRATVGGPASENTHPFVHERWIFAHNGTIRALPDFASQLLERLSPLHRRAIGGSTDSEHLFRLLLTLREEEPERPVLHTLRSALRLVLSWSRQVSSEKETSLNVLWTDGKSLVGSRLGRSLWYVEREGIHDCEICGFPHVKHRPDAKYRAVAIASERITDEKWCEVPEGAVFQVGPQKHFELEAL